MIKFNSITGINQIAWKERAAEEAKLIFAKDSTRRGRSFEEIFETCKYGQAAEQYLIENGYKDDPRPYKDVLEEDGTPIEVKVTEGEYYIPYVLERCNASASEAWRKYPNKLYVFIGDKKTYDYYLHSVYVWNGTKFCLQTRY